MNQPLNSKLAKPLQWGHACTSTLLECEKEINQFGHVITKFWAPKSISLMTNRWACPNKLCMPEIVGIMSGPASEVLTPLPSPPELEASPLA
jgi:hypothetical protein